jgi:hypothetical protein
MTSRIIMVVVVSVKDVGVAWIVTDAASAISSHQQRCTTFRVTDLIRMRSFCGVSTKHATLQLEGRSVTQMPIYFSVTNIFGPNPNLAA